MKITTLVTAFVCLASVASTAVADHVLFLGYIVDRSTIAVEATNNAGNLSFNVFWGGGVQLGKGIRINYNERFGSEEHSKAMLKLLELLRDEHTAVFGDPEFSTRIGLSYYTPATTRPYYAPATRPSTQP